MKVVLSSEGTSLESTIDVRFGRCSYFVIYDTKTASIRSVANKGQQSGGGAGIAAAQQVIDEGVDTVITGNMGPNAFKLIEKSDIKIYQCDSVSIKKAIDLFNQGQLKELTSAGKAHMGM